MNIVFTCGGTAGHVNPALALAGYLREKDPAARVLFVGTPNGMERGLIEKAGYDFPAIAVARMFRERQPDCRILFIGAEDGMENKLVPREGFELQTVQISNYQRKLTPAAIWHNLVTVQRMSATFAKTKRILKDFQPDVIVGTGGYASFPALKMGAKLGIPTCVHESNAVPGLTTKLVARTASRIMVSFDASRQHYPDPEKVLLTGTPVREEFLYARRQQARQALGLGDEPLIVSCWGSLGAREMNKKIAQFMRCECEDGTPFHHIHATGSFGWRWMPDYVKEQGVDLAAHPALDMREYIYDMPQVLAAADLIICRAGAATIAEVCASGTPCIMMPSPNVTGNHQEKNARVLEAAGGAVVVLEKDCTPGKLYELIRSLLADEDRRREMSRKLHTMVRLDSAERICDIVEQLTQSEK